MSLVVLVVGVLLLAGSVASAQAPVWDWTLHPPADGAADPGGTIEYDFTVTNYSVTPWLTIVGRGWHSLPGFPTWAHTGFDFTWSDVWGIPPGGSRTGTFLHVTWDSNATVGYSTAGELRLARPVGGSDVEWIEKPFSSTVSPELPPGALGLLSFVPYGLWQLRRRKA